MTLRSLLAPLMLFAFGFAHAASVQNIGFWEDEGVRAAFQKKGPRWISRQTRVLQAEGLRNLPLKYAKPAKWRLHASPGGNLTTAAFDRYENYLHIGLQKVVTAPALDRETSEEYATIGKSTNPRPALLTDQVPKRSPAFEKGSASKRFLDLAKSAFLRKWGDKVSFYKDAGFKFRDNQHKLRPTDLVETASFLGPDRAEVIGVQLRSPNGFAKCKAPGLECRALLPQWFLLIKGRPITLGDGQTFLDAADLGDGKLTTFLLVNRANASGYALVSQTGQRTEFTWGTL